MDDRVGIMSRETFDVLAISMAGRRYQYQLMQRLLASEPTKELLAHLVSEQGRASFELMQTGDLREKTNRLFEEIQSRFLISTGSFTEQACDEYVRCFVGPGTPLSPPWESMHVGSEKILFNEVTLGVRRFYAQAGFRPCEYPRVADDHIAIELDFMAQLAQANERAFLARGYAQALDTLRLQRLFLTEHLMRWVPALSKSLHDANQRFLYSQVVDLLDIGIKSDVALLAELEYELRSLDERKEYAKQ